MADEIMKTPAEVVEDTTATAAPSVADQSASDAEFEAAFGELHQTPAKEEAKPVEEVSKPVEAPTTKVEDKPAEKPSEAAKEAPKTDERPTGDVDPGELFVTELNKLYPNADKIAASEEFQTWAASQKHLQRALKSSDPQVAADILEMYESQKPSQPLAKPEVAKQPEAKPVVGIDDAGIEEALKTVKFKTPTGDMRTLGELSEEYGELYSGMLAMQKAIAQKLVADMQAKGPQPTAQTPVDLTGINSEVAGLKQQLAEFQAKAAIMDEHPDYSKIIKSPELEKWKGEQSGKVRYMLDSGSPEDVSKALTWFKEDTQKAAQATVKKTNASKKELMDKISGGTLHANNNRTPASAGVKHESAVDEYTHYFNSEEP